LAVCICTGEDIVLHLHRLFAGTFDQVMMKTHGHNFMLVLHKQEMSDGAEMFYTTVQLIGTRKQAENFVCR